MSATSPRKIIVTSALPYANGAIHLGHLVEYIQTDIWVRLQRMRQNECYYVCADDAHGTPIMLRAEKEGITADELIAKSHVEHHNDFKAFLIEHHQYHSTHSTENYHYVTKIYQRLQQKNLIVTKNILQAYDAEKEMFLPDRFVKGECPKCAAKDQYGDNCEVCGATYAPTDLLNPYSVLSATTPVQRHSEHYFFDLPKFTSFLKTWLAKANIQTTMRNKLQEWFDAGLQTWDISRDAPYWGFLIPETQDKYFYVWLDAPIGYIASFAALCERENIDFDEFWRKDSPTEMYHFIGKDIAYFHMLFWTAMLEGADYRLPNGIFCHGFLTVNGEKMSKSRGTFIKAQTYLKHLRPEYLRYYFASKLASTVEDIDLNFEDFRRRVNSDLVGKLVNLASRSAPFLHQHFDATLSAQLTDLSLFTPFAARAEKIANYYEQREYSQAMREIMQLADIANAYFDEQKAWVKIKNNEQKDEVQQIATVIINAFRQLIIYLKPVLPQLASDSEQFLNIAPLIWQDAQIPLLKQRINIYRPLMQRVEEKSIAAIIADSKQDLKEETTTNNAQNSNEETTINIDDFKAIDLRVATIIAVKEVEGADKLLQLRLDVGELGVREVFAGIKKHYAIEALLGLQVVYVANLASRKMRFGTSQGMILAASNGESLHILHPDCGAINGMKIS